MERDNRKTFPSKEEDNYIHKILIMLIEQILTFASTLLGKLFKKIRKILEFNQFSFSVLNFKMIA
jgi:hypothetical protein